MYSSQCRGILRLRFASLRMTEFHSTLLSMNSLAVLNASQLVTLSGPRRPRIGPELSELGIIPNGGMLIRDGQIERVGTSDEIEKNVDDAEVVDADGRVVMPG